MSNLHTSFHLHICSMLGDYYDGDCASLTLTLSDGEIGLMANHSPVAAAVVPGALRLRLPDGSVYKAAAGQGLARFEDNDALVMLETIEPPSLKKE